ncbi:COMM domain-containing protein 6-like [Babylonia areolata]|uniref:COMM domain-containing protein 6-like n=1 Tax=Babylonia areolata TaxID=304850 RepID=UPI003FD2D84D
MTSSGDSSSVQVGQLLDLQWKVGLAVSSDDCHSLNFPFVTLTLKTSDASGQHHCHTVELTLTQFRNLTQQLKDMASCMETI